MTKLTILAAAALAAMLTAGAANAQDYTIKLVAGSPGYDHIQPFMAEQMKFWDKYGLKVELHRRQLHALEPDDVDRRLRRRL